MSLFWGNDEPNYSELEIGETISKKDLSHYIAKCQESRVNRDIFLIKL